MRDIRVDLTERLNALGGEREKLKVRMAALDHKEALIRAILQQEEDRLRRAQAGSEPPSSNPGENGKYASPIARFVLSAFHRQNPVSLRQLRDAGVRERVPFGDKSPGRVIHFLLIGMEKNGLVERLGRGMWRYKGD